MIRSDDLHRHEVRAAVALLNIRLREAAQDGLQVEAEIRTPEPILGQPSVVSVDALVTRVPEVARGA